jgi:hypothetical protein
VAAGLERDESGTAVFDPFDEPERIVTRVVQHARPALAVGRIGRHQPELVDAHPDRCRGSTDARTTLRPSHDLDDPEAPHLVLATSIPLSGSRETNSQLPSTCRAASK